MHLRRATSDSAVGVGTVEELLPAVLDRARELATGAGVDLVEAP